MAYNSPASGTQSAGLSSNSTVVLPTACKPSMTIYNYTGAATPYALCAVTPNTSSSTWSIASATPVITCTPASGAAGGTCSATAGSNAAAGTIVVLTTSCGSPGGQGGGGFLVAFSCQ